MDVEFALNTAFLSESSSSSSLPCLGFRENLFNDLQVLGLVRLILPHKVLEASVIGLQALQVFFFPSRQQPMRVFLG